MCKNKFFKYVLVLLCLWGSSTMAGDFYCQAPRGFLWYDQDPVTEETKAPETEAVATKVLIQTPAQSAKARNEALKQKLDDAIQVVLDDPSLKNAVAAQRMQKEVMDRSEAVSQSWVLAALVDAGIVSPDMNPNVLHRALSKKTKAVADDNALKAIAQDWGLFFFVMEDCPHCQKFAPIVEEIQTELGFQVLAISKNGGNYGPFIGQKDTGLMQHLNPEGWAPVLYLVHSGAQRIYPVARGLTAPEKIKENILLVHKLDQEEQQKGSGQR